MSSIEIPKNYLDVLMHVVTLTPFYPCASDDAFGCFIAEPVNAIQEAGIDCSVIAIRALHDGPVQPCATAPAAEWLRYLSIPGGWGLSTAGAFLFARLISSVRRLHGSKSINLIHAHGALPCGHAAELLRRELGIPFVVTVHGLDAYFTNQVRGWPGDRCRQFSRRVYRSAKRVICISEHVRERVLEGVDGKCRTSVVYNGVDTALFAPSPRECSASPVILSAGNLIPIKGHELLLRAIASLVSDFPALTLEIIGDGPEGPRLKSLAEQLQIAGRVRLLGRQSRQRLAGAMRRCTLFALPSRYEGLGCVYLEAMSAGKPAIGCREQGIAEIIWHGRNGFLVGIDNQKELTLAIAMVLRDESLRRNIGTAARETVVDGFTLAHQAENLKRVYQESLA